MISSLERHNIVSFYTDDALYPDPFRFGKHDTFAQNSISTFGFLTLRVRFKNSPNLPFRTNVIEIEPISQVERPALSCMF